jgi:hypothetical protein
MLYLSRPATSLVCCTVGTRSGDISLSSPVPTDYLYPLKPIETQSQLILGVWTEWCMTRLTFYLLELPRERYHQYVDSPFLTTLSPRSTDSNQARPTISAPNTTNKLGSTRIPPPNETKALLDYFLDADRLLQLPLPALCKGKDAIETID